MSQNNGGLSRREFLKQAAALGSLPILSGLELVLGKEAHAQTIGKSAVQEYNLSTGQLSTTDFAQRLALPGEYLQHLTGINFRDEDLMDSLLGTVHNGANSTYLNGIDNRADVGGFIQGLTGVSAVKTRALKFPGYGSLLMVYDGRTHIHGIKIGSELTPIGDITNIFKEMFGFVPVDMISANYINNGTSPHDDALALKRHNGDWIVYPYPFSPSQASRFDLEGIFQDPSLGSIISLGAFNLNGSLIDKLYAIRHRLEGIIDAQTASDVITYNQDNINLSSYRRLGIIAKWDLPVPVYVDPSIDKRNVDEALWQNFLETGISYVLIDQDETPRVLFRAGTDGLGGVALARGGVDGVYPNNRAKSGLVVIHPNYAQYDPNFLFIYRHEFRHALGFFGHLRLEGLISVITPLIAQRENNVLKALYFQMPHGARVEADGSWRVMINTD